MQIRDALITQAPSLQLQRAAADEIARLDAKIRRLEEELEDERGRRSILDRDESSDQQQD